MKEEFLFIFGGISSKKRKINATMSSNVVQMAASVEVMDVAREICREFKSSDSPLEDADGQQKKGEAPVKIISNEGNGSLPIHGFQAL